MSSDLRDCVEAEFAQLHGMLGPRKDFVQNCLEHPPSLESIDALAALLHSFYTAVERVLLHFAKAEGSSEHIAANPETWHSRLLTMMASQRGNKPPVLSQELRNQLVNYLGFRHVFRHAYVHQLQWSRMRPLIEGLWPVCDRLEIEVRAYLDRSAEPTGHDSSK
ncbi:MAG: hypothetical protein KF858_09555 [Candidatus Sumerlaeia bacterium]|nr:hypothetical protein [Candidatus Sumerlaeia bacterium]